MDPSANLVLELKFSIDVLKRDLFITWLSVTLVVAIQRDVVDAVLFTLRRLAVLAEELYVRVVTQLLDRMGVCALLSFLLTIARHVKSADETLHQVLRQLLQPIFLHLPHLCLVLFTILFDKRESLTHVSAIGADKVHAAGGQRWYNDVDLTIAMNVD